MLYVPAISPLRFYIRETLIHENKDYIYKAIHYSTICNSKKVKTVMAFMMYVTLPTSFPVLPFFSHEFYTFICSLAALINAINHLLWTRFHARQAGTFNYLHLSY